MIIGRFVFNWVGHSVYIILIMHANWLVVGNDWPMADLEQPGSSVITLDEGMYCVQQSIYTIFDDKDALFHLFFWAVKFIEIKCCEQN